IWQPLPKAILYRDQIAAGPWSKQYELVTGSMTYRVVPHWHHDALADLRAAIESAHANVTATIERHDDLRIVSDTPLSIRVTSIDAGDNGPTLLEEVGTVVRVSVPWKKEWLGAAKLAEGPDAPIAPPKVFYLLNDDETAMPIVFDYGTPADAIPSWRK